MDEVYDQEAIKEEVIVEPASENALKPEPESPQPAASTDTEVKDEKTEKQEGKITASQLPPDLDDLVGGLGNESD